MEIANKNITICDIIADFMEKKRDAVASLQEIYHAVNGSWEKLKNSSPPADETIRAAIYRAPKKYDFERIGKGLYLLKGEETASLLIHGDGREMKELDDNSIDCILTDHPWSDKKAHKSGNQKGFAEYSTFEYTLEDFKTKARVLKDGSFLAEFLPIESATNWKYLEKIRNMAAEAGFEYYAQCIWRKAPEGAVNTGRTTKGVEQVLIFSKGKPRRLAPTGKPYLTHNMLSYEIDIPANKGKEKTHQAEKPIALYEYLLRNLTNEQEIALDSFGGSCNLLKACTNLSRWGIVYELCKRFVVDAVDRFGMYSLYVPKEDQVEDPVPIVAEPVTYVAEIISSDTTDFQYAIVQNLRATRSELFTSIDLFILDMIEDNKYDFAIEIDRIYHKVMCDEEEVA